MSTVFYRWGAAREESRVTFDGTHISVFDLKREVMLGNKMGNGRDFDLGVFDNVTGEELKDDNHQVPRSSSVVIKRLPASLKGRAPASRYILGTSAADSLTGDHRIEAHARDAMQAKARGIRGNTGTFGSLTKRFDGKEDKPEGPVITTGDAEEDAKIQAMFAQSADLWEQTQEDMSQRPHLATSYRPKPKPAAASSSKFDFSMPPDREPPVGYICYRCGQKGHWIQDCPNAGDATSQEQKRFVRVTGIPRSFLKTVGTPTGGEGSSRGAMLTADGGFVRAVPDQRQWQKQVGSKTRTLTSTEVRDAAIQDESLICPICRKLFLDPVLTPCCRSAFCEECITNHLVEYDFECPSCESKVPSLKSLIVDGELLERVKGYVDGEIARSRKEKEEEEAGQTTVDKQSEEGSVPPDRRDGKLNNGDVNGSDGSTAAVTLDAKMEEMLRPQNLTLYFAQVAKMLQNPKLNPQARFRLESQRQQIQMAVMQRQMMGIMGTMPMPPAAMMAAMPGMAAMAGMGMGMGGGNGMNGMGGMNGMNSINGMGMMPQMNGMGGGIMNSRGRGFPRGRGRGFGGRGMGGAAGLRGPKRGAEQAGFEMNGGEKVARVS